MFTCNGVCVTLTVVFALILACISVGLFLALGFGCRRIISKWGWGSLRRPRNNASVTTSEGINLDRRPQPLQSVNTITSGELPPASPYPESTLSSYSPYSNTNFSTQTSVTSVNPPTTRTENSELPIPPTPLISTVPLPLVEVESPIDDTAQPNFLSQQNSNDARFEIDEQRTLSIDEIQFSVGSTGPNDSADLDVDLVQPTGSLGLILFKSPASCDVWHSVDLGDFEEKSNFLAPHAEGDPSLHQSASEI